MEEKEQPPPTRHQGQRQHQVFRFQQGIVPGPPARVPTPGPNRKATQRRALPVQESKSQLGLPFHLKLAKAGSNAQQKLRSNAGRENLAGCQDGQGRPGSKCKDLVWLGKGGNLQRPIRNAQLHPRELTTQQRLIGTGTERAGEATSLIFFFKKSKGQGMLPPKGGG